jgi:hypothetical protein
VEVSDDASLRRIADDAQSLPAWSPDGRDIAFLRRQGACEGYCRYRIVVVPSIGGEEQKVGPELIEPSDEAERGGLAWVTGPVLTAPASSESDPLELQRCVDIWNRARMQPWTTGLLNVSIVQSHCQVTLGSYGGICTQADEMPFRYWCPSHGAGLHMLPPEYRVPNGHPQPDGGITLFDPAKGARLPLPKAPPYPLLDGFVVPFDENWEPIAALKLENVSGTCPWVEGSSKDLVDDRYALRCWWDGSGGDNCFKRPGELKVGDFVLCPDFWYGARYDPMSFTRVEVTSTD